MLMLIDALKRAFRPRPLQAAVALACFAAVLLFVGVVTVKSDAYEFAEDFVARDERILRVTGRQTERSLRWLGGFSMSYGDNSGDATLTVRVVGDRGSFDIPLELRKSQGRWSVVRAMAINERGDRFVIAE
jgi:hypothetical protein